MKKKSGKTKRTGKQQGVCAGGTGGIGSEVGTDAP